MKVTHDLDWSCIWTMVAWKVWMSTFKGKLQEIWSQYRHLPTCCHGTGVGKGCGKSLGAKATTLGNSDSKTVTHDSWGLISKSEDKGLKCISNNQDIFLGYSGFFLSLADLFGGIGTIKLESYSQLNSCTDCCLGIMQTQLSGTELHLPTQLQRYIFSCTDMTNAPLVMPTLVLSSKLLWWALW